VEGQYDVVFRDSRIYQPLREHEVGAVVLNPDFSVRLYIQVYERQVFALVLVPTNGEQDVVAHTSNRFVTTSFPSITVLRPDNSPAEHTSGFIP
jgi:hypothetical protein